MFKVKLEKVTPFVRPNPALPDPVMLAMAWVNGHAQQGWMNPALKVEFTAAGPVETVTLSPTIDIRGEKYVQLTFTETPKPGTQKGWQYKLEKVAPFVRPTPQMPDPLQLAVAWLNGQGQEGWHHPDVKIEFTAAPVETVKVGPTVDVRGVPHLLLRRQVDVAAPAAK